MKQIELMKSRVVMDIFKTFIRTPKEPVELLCPFKSIARNTKADCK